MGVEAKLQVPEFKGECLMVRGVEVKNLFYVQPCVSESGKIMADVELVKEPEPETQFIDPPTLCFLLEIYREGFTELKCSSSLGVAKFKWGRHEISVFKNGKLKIQRASNRKEILRIANSISRIIWGATICRLCGEPTLRCASGGCGKCTSPAKPPKNVITLEEHLSATPLVKAFDNLKLAEAARANKGEFERYLDKARHLALSYVVEAPEKHTASLGLILLGIAEKMR